MAQIPPINFTFSANQTATNAAPEVGNTPFYTWINVLMFGKILAGTGCVLEALNIIVFVHPDMRKSKNGCNMNTYLLAKAVCDMFYFVFWLLSQNLLCSSCSGNTFEFLADQSQHHDRAEWRFSDLGSLSLFHSTFAPTYVYNSIQSVQFSWALFFSSSHSSHSRLSKCSWKSSKSSRLL